MVNFHTYKIKVYYEDTDAGGIVYYANFLKFIERARTEMIYQKLGMSHMKINKDYNKLNLLENFLSLLHVSINSIKKYNGKHLF